MYQSSGQRAISGHSRSISVGLPKLRIEHLWVLLPAALVVWMSFMHPLRRLDFWWHLKVGEVIFKSGEIPRVDVFSFTRAGEPFLYQNWLGEILYYLTYRAGGLSLLVAGSSFLLLLTLIPVYRLCLEANGRLRIATLSALVAAFVLGLYSNLRPQSYSFVLFAWFYWIVWGYLEGRRDYLWTLPLLMAVWVNLHGAFVLGIGMLGLVLIAEAVRRLVLGPQLGTLTPRRLAKLALILGLMGLATLANPETYRVFGYVRQLQVDPASQMFVTEWQVPDIKALGHVLTFFGPFFLILLALLYARRRLSLTELGLFLAFTVFGLAASRSGIWFALVVAPILARYVADLEIPNLSAGLRGRPYLGRIMKRLRRRPQSRQSLNHRLNWMIFSCLVLFTVILSPWVRPHFGAVGWNRPLIEEGTPVGAMNFVEEHRLQGNIFHPQKYGDYLIWRLWPEQRSFIDGRVHLYDEEFVRDYLLTFHDDGWQSRIAKYDIDYLLLPKDDPNVASMSEDARASVKWSVLYEDQVSILFRKEPR